MDNNEYKEQVDSSEIVVVADADYLENVDNDEVKSQEEFGKVENTTPVKAKKDQSDLVKRIAAISATGVAVTMGALIILGISMVNFNYEASFEKFEYVDGYLEYEVNASDVKSDNTLNIYLYEGQLLKDTYELIVSFDDLQKDTELVSASLNNQAITTDLDNVGTLIEEMEETDELKLELKDETNTRSYTITGGDTYSVSGKLSFNTDNLKDKLRIDKYVTYNATLKGSAGLVDRTFGNKAIHVERFVSEFLSDKCYSRCKHNEDGNFYVHLEFRDDLQIYSNFKITLTDRLGKTVEADLANQDLHDDIRIYVAGVLAEGHAVLEVSFDETVDGATTRKVFTFGEMNEDGTYDYDVQI